MADSIRVVELQVHRMVTVFTVFQSIAIPVLLLRLWARAVILRKVGIDDYAIALAWVIFTGAYVNTHRLPNLLRDFMHGKVTSFDQFKIMIQADIILYVIGMALIKVSLGAFFWRIFTVAHTTQRVLIAVMVTLGTLLSIVLAIFSGVTCGAVSGLLGNGNSCKYWRPYGHLSLAWSVFNTFGDFFFAVLSILTLWNVQMTWRTKLLTCFILILGTLGGISSFIRLYIMAFAETNIIQDFQTAIWSVVEMGMGLVAPSLACLHPVVTKLFGHLRTGQSRLEGLVYGHSPEGSRTASSTVETRRPTVVTVISNFWKSEKGPSDNTNQTEEPLSPRYPTDAV